MDDFFTLTSFATLTGSVVAVVVIINALRHSLNWGPRWFGLVVSIFIAFVAYYLTTSLGTESKTASLGWVKYFTVFVNGCLIYTSAFGIQNTVVANSSTTKDDLSFQEFTEDNAQQFVEKKTFRSTW